MNLILEYRNIVRVEINDEPVQKEDFAALEKAVVSMHNINEYVNILVHISHLRWVTWKASLESLRMLTKNKDVVKKIAIVSNKKIYELGTKIDNLFTPWEEKYFDVSEMEEAWDWLKEK